MGTYRHFCTFRNWNSEIKLWMYLDHVLRDGEILKLNTSSNLVHGDWKVSNCILAHSSTGVRTGDVYEVTLDRTVI